MRHNYTISTERNTMSNGGILSVYFNAFSSKSECETNIVNNYKQSCSIDFQHCSFTGKEKDEETGYGYFGARYMDHELMTMWLSVDPLADKYQNISPYAYCAWNPVKLIDPDGCLIDDYFSYNGIYLGSDDAKTDNVRIINEERWNELSNNGRIKHSDGYKNSDSFSSVHSQMNTEAQLEVYQHYNPTKCKLYATFSHINPGNSGMVTTTVKGESKIGIFLEDNYKGIAVADHAREIENMFVHEGQHVIDHKRNPGWADFDYENSALDAQFHHDSWVKCRPEYKHAVTNYGRKASTLGSSFLDLFDPYSSIWNP